jgi:hypothetical protein
MSERIEFVRQFQAGEALVERLWRLVEMTAADIGLAAATGCVENHQ